MELPPPQCEPIVDSQPFAKLAVRTLPYDNDRLVVYLQAEGCQFVRVDFDHVRVFRMLDEGDLCDFWDKYHTGKGWLYRVLQIGWFDLQSTRNDFITPRLFANGIHEFLIVCGTCVSVLSTKDPTITRFGYSDEGTSNP